jgi:mRNA interferase YafQ
MKYAPVYTTQLQKDIKRVQRQHKDTEKFKAAVVMIVRGEPLPARYRNHKLIGSYKDRWECHIEPDWLLIYKIDGATVIFERTGSHAELFE